MSSPVVSFPPPARTILIVDDQPSVLAALAYVFNAQQYTTLIAAKGADALALAETQSFDVALIDLHMPGMDGIAVCRTLIERARARGRNVPIWVMTAAHTREAEMKSLDAGARGLLKKPFDALALVRDIEAFLANPPPLTEPAPIAPITGTQAVA